MKIFWKIKYFTFSRPHTYTMESQIAKTKLTARLLVEVFSQDIGRIQLGVGHDGVLEHDGRVLPASPRPFMVIKFKKNPALEFKTYLALTDTWNSVKSKVKKFSESDGLCVVCFEPQETTSYAHSCPTCCEITCQPCLTTVNKTTCPVCRSCLLAEQHALYKTECKH
jgi:hypothetical protein